MFLYARAQLKSEILYTCFGWRCVCVGRLPVVCQWVEPHINTQTHMCHSTRALGQRTRSVNGD